MNPTLEIAGFDEHALAGWMRLELKTPATTLQAFANEDAPPQFLLGVEGAAEPALVDRILAALHRLDVRRETASAFALPADIAPFDRLGFVRGPERRLLRGILEDDAVLQAFPMYECELTAEGRLPPLANFRRWTDVLALARAPQPWFHFRMNGRPSGLDAPQWGTQSWAGIEDFVDILSRDDPSWLEVRNRKGRILRLPGSHGWDCARERIAAHVGREIGSGDDSDWAQTRAG
ncbi:MAG: hypothetical protein ACJ8IK_25790 [Burkholderiaceae bacterium]|jgi:hypothetical protein